MLISSTQTLQAYGGAGLLLAVIGWLWRLLNAAEKRHSAEQARTSKQHASELSRINEAHNAELRELKQDIAELRGEIDRLRDDLEKERLRRYAAEDRAGR